MLPNYDKVQSPGTTTPKQAEWQLDADHYARLDPGGNKQVIRKTVNPAGSPKPYEIVGPEPFDLTIT